jgi:hypothetical protein
MYTGSWCLGFGMGNLDGWNGDYSIHVLSAGMLRLLREKHYYVSIFAKKNFKKWRLFF